MRQWDIMETMLQRPMPIRLIGAHDGLTARLGEEAGFDAIWASGLEITASYGARDDSSLPRHCFVARVAQMAAATAAPVLADVDTGFGDAKEVANTVRLFEEAGAQGICIEDKVFPKRNSFATGEQTLEAIDVFCDKLHAALAARQRSSFIIVARTEALIADVGAPEALRRLQAYAAAGANAVVIHSRSAEPSEVTAILKQRCAEVPMGVIPTTYYNVTASALGAAGARFIIYANHGLRAQVAALKTVYDEVLRTGSTATSERSLAPIREIFCLQDRTTQQAHKHGKTLTAEGVAA